MKWSDRTAQGVALDHFMVKKLIFGLMPDPIFITALETRAGSPP
jgi:hypothetical protein